MQSLSLILFNVLIKHLPEGMSFLRDIYHLSEHHPVQPSPTLKLAPFGAEGWAG